MPHAPNRQSLGILGEELACAELVRRGYAVLARRHRTRFGEIDIIARRDGVIAFVEVKARRTASRGTAVDAVSSRKRRRIAAMALDYLAWTQRLNHPCRFVVVAIDGIDTARQTVQVIEDAWTVDSMKSIYRSIDLSIYFRWARVKGTWRHPVLTKDQMGRRPHLKSDR